MALDHIPPNARLMRELILVASESKRVADIMRGINLMPRNFPVEATEEICISLAHLKDGTAEGCVEPLNYARHVLPLIRRDHFYIDGNEPEPEDEEDTFFNRDNPLDLAVMRLYVAVGTALDEYRSQAQDKYDDSIGVEEMLEFGEDGAFSDISARSQNVAVEIKTEQAALNKIAIEGSIEAEKLDRQLQDGANLSHSILSQIRIRPVVARWYRAASKALGALPEILVTTADRMVVGVDIAEIWHNEWAAYKQRVRKLVYDQIRGLARAVKATGERLKKAQTLSKNKFEQQRDPNVIEAEKQIREMLLSGVELPSEIANLVEQLTIAREDELVPRPQDLSVLKNIERLTINGVNARLIVNGGYLQDLPELSVLRVGNSVNLSKIVPLKSLTHLSVQDHEASDLSPLGELSNLTSLSVHASRVSDLSALGELSNLTHLSVQDHEASDLSPLGELSNLTSLSVHASRVSDLSALGKLSNLTSLTVNESRVSDLSALGELSNLTSLSVHASRVSDLSALGKLSNLTSLSVHASKANDFSALGELSNLTSLTVQANEVSDLSALGKLSNLTSFNLHASKVSDFSALGKLSNLTSLSVHASKANDLSALGELSNLTSLTVQANEVSDLSALGELSNLTSFNLHASKVSDLSALGKLSNLTSLSVHASKANDLSALGELSNLTSLTVQANEVSDLSALGKLSNLTSLSVHASKVSDLSALGELSNLTSLSVHASKANDLSALGELSNLTSLNLHASKVSDLSALGELSNLTSLSVQASEASSLSSINKLHSLKVLHLSQMGNINLAVFKQMTSLEELRLNAAIFENSEALSHVKIIITGESQEI